MRALVTGAQGFIGSHLCRALAAAGHDVLGVAATRRPVSSRSVLGVDTPLLHEPAADAVLRTRPEWVFHLAGVSDVQAAAEDPTAAARLNFGTTMDLLEACEAAGGLRAFVLASSYLVYGAQRGQRPEQTPLVPRDSYEQSKAAADLAVREWARDTGQPGMTLRACNVYGPGDLRWSRLVPATCYAVCHGWQPEIHAGAWDLVREWVPVEAVAQAYIAVAERGTPGQAYNCGGAALATAGAVAEMLCIAGGVGYPAEGGPLRTRNDTPPEAMDCSRLRALGWVPPVPALGCGLAHTLAWYREWWASLDRTGPYGREVAACV